MNNEQCNSKKNCPVNCFIKLVIASVPVAIALMGYEYLIHVKWLMELYKTTPNLWRTDEEMKAVTGGGMCLLRMAAMSIAITALYCKTKKKSCTNCEAECAKKCPIQQGICFGAALGLLMGTMMASSYFWMPISAELGQKWFIAGLGEGLVAGLVLGIICKICKKKCGSGAASCNGSAS